MRESGVVIPIWRRELRWAVRVFEARASGPPALRGEEAEGLVFAEAGEGGVGVGEFEEAGFGVAEGEAEALVHGRLCEGGDAA